jgi:2-oxoglutarate ferredoxin oxidoreductase subunit delta
MAEVKIDFERCKGCELCALVCPKEILKKSNKINSKGYQYIELTDREKCIGCGMCAFICPDVAIEVWK